MTPTNTSIFSERTYHPEESLEFWSIVAARSLRRNITRTFKKKDFSINYDMYLILNSLWRENGQSRKKLADILHLHPSVVAKTVKKLKQAGYVAEEGAAKKTKIMLLPAGRLLQKELVEGSIETLGRAHQNISKQEWETCINVMKRVMLNLSPLTKF